MALCDVKDLTDVDDVDVCVLDVPVAAVFLADSVDVPAVVVPALAVMTCDPVTDPETGPPAPLIPEAII